MKLEHVSPYLPYKVNICETETNRQYELIPYKRQHERLDRKMTLQEFMNHSDNKFKLILQPLSNLNSETSHKLIKESRTYEVSFEIVLIVEGDIKIEDISVKTYNWLLENHYDVSGLIEQKIAIDINSI